MKYVSELRMIDKMKKTPHFSPILKWKHPSIWQLFWCDRKLPFDDYELYLVYMVVEKEGLIDQSKGLLTRTFMII